MSNLNWQNPSGFDNYFEAYDEFYHYVVEKVEWNSGPVWTSSVSFVHSGISTTLAECLTEELAKLLCQAVVDKRSKLNKTHGIFNRAFNLYAKFPDLISASLALESARVAIGDPDLFIEELLPHER